MTEQRKKASATYAESGSMAKDGPRGRSSAWPAHIQRVERPPLPNSLASRGPDPEQSQAGDPSSTMTSDDRRPGRVEGPFPDRRRDRSSYSSFPPSLPDTIEQLLPSHDRSKASKIDPPNRTRSLSRPPSMPGGFYPSSLSDDDGSLAPSKTSSIHRSVVPVRSKDTRVPEASSGNDNGNGNGNNNANGNGNRNGSTSQAIAWFCTSKTVAWFLLVLSAVVNLVAAWALIGPEARCIVARQCEL
ncbi:hypothetical protein AC579_1126, partial [Pseudocercospora musae]